MLSALGKMFSKKTAPSTSPQRSSLQTTNVCSTSASARTMTIAQEMVLQAQQPVAGPVFVTVCKAQFIPSLEEFKSLASNPETFDALMKQCKNSFSKKYLNVIRESIESLKNTDQNQEKRNLEVKIRVRYQFIVGEKENDFSSLEKFVVVQKMQLLERRQAEINALLC